MKTAIAGLVVGSTSVAGAIVGIIAFALAVAMTNILLGNRAVILSIGMALLGFVAGFLFADIVDKNQLILTTPIVLVLILLGIYIGTEALSENIKYYRIKIIAILVCCQGGTNFHSANLTDANFTQATLKNTDFREAIITRTFWYKAKQLEFIRSGKSYLHNTQVIQLLVGEKGKDTNFNRLSLRGINLQGANLQDVSFIGADLSEANLQNADLSRAKLKQTQLDGTDFTGATLTGAYIEDWGITTDTKVGGIRCEYVYMRLPTKDNPDPHRKPDNRQEVFADGEFGDFIKPIFDTLDLYHNQGVDPRAIAIAFKELAENNPEAELEIVAIERRGEDKILLRAKTASTANKSELSRNYFINYNQLKALAEKDFKALIEEKQYQINKLENMITTALERPSFYAQTYQNQGDIIMAEGSKKQSNFDLKGAQFAGGLVNADTVNAGQIGGNMTNYSPEQRQNLAEAAAEIQQVLNQLSQTYPTNTPLEKQIAITEALKQIDSNPTLKARVIGALKAGGTEALKELVDHPLVNILLATLEGWQDVE
ncbi:pentapeptide repeat-containing protein [Nostoc sp.]|uniref:pentapeptide repeat-containing protein n=1 Tax=Nostoc sp. TaxID=1180 RepID=UPI002FF8CA7F